MSELSLQTIDAVRQFLAFRLDEEVFALDVAHIREILECTDITRIPRTPEFMRGVINLRGSVVPVIDLRMRFDLGAVEHTVDTVIIVVEVAVGGESAVIGALVDAVQEVFELDASQIEEPPRIGTTLGAEFIEGMGRRDDGFVIVLDTDKIFSADDLLAVGDVVHDAEGDAADAVCESADAE